MAVNSFSPVVIILANIGGHLGYTPAMASIHTYSAERADFSDWLALLELQDRTLPISLGVPQDAVNELTGFSDPARFIESHQDPNSEVGRRFAADQQYHKAGITVARNRDGVMVGALTFAHNVSYPSGLDDQERTAVINRKRQTIIKDYLWLREVVVAQEYQGRGIASWLLMATLLKTMPLRRPATYIWPDLLPRLQPGLERLGFEPTGESNARIFGEDSQSVRQVRMQASSAITVAGRLGYHMAKSK